MEVVRLDGTFFAVGGFDRASALGAGSYYHSGAARINRMLSFGLKIKKGRLGLACSTTERRYILDVPVTGFPFKRPGADEPPLGAAA